MSIRVLLAVLAALALAAPAQAASPGLSVDLNWGISNAEQDAEAARVRESGADWVRMTLRWSTVETSQGVYDPTWLAHTDRAVALARAAGAKVLISIYEAPAWASGSSSRNTPANPATIAPFAEYVAKRYAGKVDAWEVWNEPDLTHFWNSGYSPAAYTALLRAAYPALKRGDPSARVVFGGLDYTYYAWNGGAGYHGKDFVMAAYEAGAKGFFDVMAVHPYTACGQKDPGETDRYPDGWIQESSFARYRNIRSTMLANGDDKPIFLSEFGWNTSSAACNPSAGVHHGGVSEATQAEYLTKAFEVMAEDPYVEAAFWYSFRNWETDADAPNSRYGLLRSDFSPKPSFAAFKAVADGTAAAPRSPATPAPTGTAPAPGPAADAAPTVTLTAPTAGARFTRTLRLAAEASDDHGVTKVQFRVGGKLVATDTVAPYVVTYRVPAKLAVGTHVVTATALDAAGHSTTTPRRRAQRQRVRAPRGRSSSRTRRARRARAAAPSSARTGARSPGRRPTTR